MWLRYISKQVCMSALLCFSLIVSIWIYVKYHGNFENCGRKYEFPLMTDDCNHRWNSRTNNTQFTIHTLKSLLIHFMDSRPMMSPVPVSYIGSLLCHMVQSEEIVDYWNFLKDICIIHKIIVDMKVFILMLYNTPLWAAIMWDVTIYIVIKWELSL